MFGTTRRRSGVIFPEIERGLGENNVGFWVAFDAATGLIFTTGARRNRVKQDGQCGRILAPIVKASDERGRRPAYLAPRARRPSDFRFCTTMIWTATAPLDGAAGEHPDGLVRQNRVDCPYAPRWWAGEAMATDLRRAWNSPRFAGRKFAQTKALETELFNGEYFIQKPEPGHEKSL